jgi:hypothetical protein
VIGGVKVFNGINANPWIIVTDTSGAIIKEKEFITGAISTCTIWVFPTLDQNYLVHGCMDTIIDNGDYDHPSYIGKLDTNFNLLWSTFINNPQENDVYFTKQLEDSTIVYVGFQVGGIPNAPEGMIGKLDKNGNKLWEHQYRHDNSLFNYFSDFEQTYDGGFIITGSSDGPTGQDMWLVKLDSMGCLEPCATNTGTFETTDNSISLQCYPNPARTQTSVLYNIPESASKASIIINDLSGKRLSIFDLDRFANSTDLPLTSWSPGVYFCSLMIDGVISKTIKLIVTQ